MAEPLKLCIPVSGAFRSCASALLPLVDAVTFKNPSPELYVGKAHFLECSLNVGDSEFPVKLRESGLLGALESGKYDAFACDIGPNCNWALVYSSNGFPRSVPTSVPVSDDRYVETAVRNVRWLRSWYGGDIQVENLNYFPTGAYERVCDPGFIRRVIEETDVTLLLDIAHATVSAHYLEYADPMAYLREMPLNRVQQIQLSHAGRRNGIFEDLHEVPQEAEISVVRALLAMGCRAAYVTVEYYGDADVLCYTYRSLARTFGVGQNRADLP